MPSKRMCICAHVFVRMCVCACMFMCECVCVRVSCVRVCTCVCLRACVYAGVCIFEFSCLRALVGVHMFVHVCIKHIYTELDQKCLSLTTH